MIALMLHGAAPLMHYGAAMIHAVIDAVPKMYYK
jgi:hypothetical protein